MNFRTLHWSLVAVTAAVTLALSGLVSAPANALTKRAVSVTAAPAYTVGGAPVTFAGKLTKSPKGSLVKIQRRSGTTWVAAGQTRTTSASGSYAVRLKAPTTAAAYAFRAVAPRAGALAAATSPRNATVIVVRPVATTLTIAPGTILRGQSARFAGAVSTFNPGTQVTVQRQSGSTWVAVGTAPVSSARTFALDVTPAAAGTFSYRAVTPLNGLNAPSASATRSLAVTAPEAPVITTASLPNGYQQLAYSTTLAATGGPGTWSIPAATLPGGLSLDPATGVLSGTPTGSGSRTLAVTFTSASGSSTKNLPILVYPLPTITTATLPDATQGAPYTAALAGESPALNPGGIPGGLVWSAQNLPAGLTLDRTSGVITGTTSVPAGKYVVLVTLKEDLSTRSSTKAFELNVLPGQVTPPTGPAITTTALPNGSQYLPYGPVTLTRTGGTGVWSVPAGSLPGGLSLDPGTGVLSGTPTGSGSRTLAVTFTETGTGLKATKNLPITITAAPTITTTSLPPVTRGAPYSATLELVPASSGTWSVVGLPAGLSINQLGVISGATNAAPGVYGVYPKFVETGTGRTAQTALSLTVGGTGLAITTGETLPEGHQNLPYALTFTKSGGPGTWSAVSVPAGFTVNPTTGAFTGTPAAPGYYAVRIRFTETGTGASVDKTFLFPAVGPKVTTTSVPPATTGTAYSTQLTKTGLDGTWGISGVLPEGMGFTTSGLLSGTPTEAGEFGIQVTFQENATGVSSKQGYVLHVEAPGSPQITTASVLPNGRTGTPYAATLAATPTGGTWSITQGSLPVGLSLNPLTGAISGTPTVSENARFVATYTRGSTSNTKFFVLTVPAP